MIDSIILLLMMGMIYSGFRQGLAKDFIHFVLWISTDSLMAMATFASLNPAQVDPSEAYKIVKNLGYLFSFAYLMMMLVEKFVIFPAIFGSMYHRPSPASAALGATFGFCKMLLIIFSTTFLFNVYSQSADPDMPPLLQNSFILSSVESSAADLYEYVTDQGWLDYNKVVWEAEQEPTAQEKYLGKSFYKQLLDHNGTTK